MDCKPRINKMRLAFQKMSHSELGDWTGEGGLESRGPAKKWQQPKQTMAGS